MLTPMKSTKNSCQNSRIVWFATYPLIELKRKFTQHDTSLQKISDDVLVKNHCM
jgi:hypothetical protein